MGQKKKFPRMFCHYLKMAVSSVDDISNHWNVHSQAGGSPHHPSPGDCWPQGWDRASPDPAHPLVQPSDSFHLPPSRLLLLIPAPQDTRW